VSATFDPQPLRRLFHERSASSETAAVHGALPSRLESKWATVRPWQPEPAWHCLTRSLLLTANETVVPGMAAPDRHALLLCLQWRCALTPFALKVGARRRESQHSGQLRSARWLARATAGTAIGGTDRGPSGGASRHAGRSPSRPAALRRRPFGGQARREARLDRSIARRRRSRQTRPTLRSRWWSAVRDPGSLKGRRILSRGCRWRAARAGAPVSYAYREPYALY
jgi:hypothetical protein